MKYYILKNGQQQGPFTIDQLRSQNITGVTYVWHKGMAKWGKVKDCPELQSIFQTLQQPQTIAQAQAPELEQPVESAKQAPLDEQRQQPQSSQSTLESQDIEDEDEPKSNMGLIFGLGLGGIVLILIVAAVLCIPQLRFWESMRKSDLLETAYNAGYNCGKQFGSMTRCDELFEMANNTYNSEEVVPKDDFQQQFTLGMEAGVEESPYKGFVVDVENISGTYAGTLGEYDITMTLNQSKSNIDGSYTYTKYGNTLNLSGSIDGTEISLNETTPKGNNSANWSLKYVDKTLVGTINVFHTGKTHEVNLRLME